MIEVDSSVHQNSDFVLESSDGKIPMNKYGNKPAVKGKVRPKRYTNAERRCDNAWAAAAAALQVEITNWSGGASWRGEDEGFSVSHYGGGRIKSRRAGGGGR
jgi:hypothetical protein